MSAVSDEKFVLIVKCPDTKGIVAAVSGYLADNDASITESNHFNDSMTNQFYMRTVFRADGNKFPPLDLLLDGLRPIARRFDMEWEISRSTVKPRIMLAVSKIGHCLYDILHRWRSGSLDVEIPAVVSNHEDMRSFVEWSGIPFHHLPIRNGQKAEQEAEILRLVADQKIDLVVLARYMQVLSPDMCAQLSGRCINIHHSFLPSFKGAKPYYQAFDRGVKLIGATAHYVTTDLDEGPIIEQEVERVDHSMTPDQLTAIGRDVECVTLARAVKWHVEHRIVLNGSKTVVFR
jgi:formyltetrahydrofolate deformylase